MTHAFPIENILAAAKERSDAHDARNSRPIPFRGPLADADFRPQPQEIVINDHLFNAFGESESEVSADWLVRFAIARGQGWSPFSEEEINVFYHAKFPNENFTFNRLVEAGVGYGLPGERYLTGGGWIVEKDGLYHFTEEFINRCYMAATGRNLDIEIIYGEDARYPF